METQGEGPLTRYADLSPEEKAQVDSYWDDDPIVWDALSPNAQAAILSSSRRLLGVLFPGRFPEYVEH